MKKIVWIMIVACSMAVSAKAQYITASIDGQTITRKAERLSGQTYYARPVAIYYNEYSGKAMVVYFRGHRIAYLGETTAALSTSNVGVHTLQSRGSCRLYNVEKTRCNLDDGSEVDVLNRLLGLSIRSSSDYVTCSNFVVEW